MDPQRSMFEEKSLVKFINISIPHIHTVVANMNIFRPNDSEGVKLIGQRWR